MDMKLIKENYEQMASLWQKLSRESFAHAEIHRDKGDLRTAAYCQRQAARDHREMIDYLTAAIAIKL